MSVWTPIQGCAAPRPTLVGTPHFPVKLEALFGLPTWRKGCRAGSTWEGCRGLGQAAGGRALAPLWRPWKTGSQAGLGGGTVRELWFRAREQLTALVTVKMLALKSATPLSSQTFLFPHALAPRYDTAWARSDTASRCVT